MHIYKYTIIVKHPMNKDAFRQTTYSLDVCFIIPYSTENDQTYVFSYMTVNAI